MILAHASIHLGIQGENGAWAGDERASLQAVRAAYWAVAEGRSPAAIICGADSAVEFGAARDRLRQGRHGPAGEGAAALRIEPLASATSPLATLHLAANSRGLPDHRPQLGDCGAAEGLMAVAIAVLAGRAATIGPLVMQPWGE
jgi:hypothetical protein